MLDNEDSCPSFLEQVSSQGLFLFHDIIYQNWPRSQYPLWGKNIGIFVG
jgi:hypothetical protein